MEDTILSKFKGCFLGLTIADALGAPVEFLSLTEIKRKYGEDGITDFDAWAGFKAGSYTDDSQLSLATAVGCIQAYQRLIIKGECNSVNIIYKRYLEWVESQSNQFQIRSPNYTCLSALMSGKMGSIENPINDSKESGGLARFAPVGLAFPSDMAFREGIEYASITHGNPQGYLPGGFLSELIAHILEGKNLGDSIELSTERLSIYERHEETLKKIEKALELFTVQEPIENSIREIGEGWTGEEALAIALFCSLKFSDDYEKGIQAAVNHSGSSDSTGSVTGAILGTLLGIEAIPDKWVLNVENSQTICQIAKDMFKIFKKKERLSFKKYPLD